MREGRRPPHLLLLSLGLLLALAGCRGEEAGGGPDPSPPDATAEAEPGIGGPEVRVRDDAGRSWVLDAPPSRIVSLVPSATGILLALGMEDRLVGRTDFDRAPALAGLPSVGGGLEPSLERLASLEPDLVVRFEGPSDRATPRTLDELGIPHLAVRPDTIGDVFRILSLLAEVAGVPDRGLVLGDSLQTELAAVRSTVGDALRPRVVFVLGGDPPWVAGAGTFLHELIEIAGGENIFADTGPLYAPVALEEVIRREPELVLATEGARIPGALDRFPTLRLPETIQSPGLEVAHSASLLARALHPDRFP